MNFQKHKIATKIGLSFLSIIMLWSHSGVVQAAGGITCEDVTNPEKTKGYIVTVLEEQVGNPIHDAKTDENVINCFRNTETCAEDNKQTCAQIGSTCTTLGQCKRVQVYYARSGADLLYVYVGRIYKWASGTIGIVAVLFLVIGGIEMAAAGGDAGKLDKAKERIVQSLSGLVLLFLSALILYTINPNFFTL